MPASGIALAPAPTRALIGPVQTQAGFQFWYLACFPDCIVAVRQGIFTGLLLSMSGNIAHVRFAGLGHLMTELLNDRANKKRRQVEAGMANIPTSRLRMEPNRVFEVAQLRSITLDGRSFAGVITPDIVFETTSGSQQKYGIRKPDFEKASAQLKQMYPSLFKLN
jgi:hypothetical protein